MTAATPTSASHSCVLLQLPSETFERRSFSVSKPFTFYILRRVYALNNEYLRACVVVLTTQF